MMPTKMITYKDDTNYCQQDANTSKMMLTKMTRTTANKMRKPCCKLLPRCDKAAMQQQTLQTATGQQQKPAICAPTDSNGASDRASKQAAR